MLVRVRVGVRVARVMGACALASATSSAVMSASAISSATMSASASASAAASGCALRSDFDWQVQVRLSTVLRPLTLGY